MTPYQTHYEVSRTLPTWSNPVFMLSGLLLAASTPTGAFQAPVPPPSLLDLRSYGAAQNAGTYSQFQNMFTRMYNRLALDFEAAISTF